MLTTARAVRCGDEGRYVLLVVLKVVTGANDGLSVIAGEPYRPPEGAPDGTEKAGERHRLVDEYVNFFPYHNDHVLFDVLSMGCRGVVASEKPVQQFIRCPTLDVVAEVWRP